MEIGKVPESVLRRSCFNQIKHFRPEVLLGSGVGEDCAAISLADDEELVLSTDPITGTAKDIGKLAVVVTANDLASSGAEPIGILITALLPPETEEADLRGIMRDVVSSCEAANIEVIGGHTEVTAAVTQPILSVTGVAKVKKGRLISTAGASPDEDVIVTKWVGLEGTSIIAKEKEAELKTHFPAAMIDTAIGFDEYLSVLPEAYIAAKCGATAMHDVTEGGIFGALWELAEASGVGLNADLRKIPIRQETVEIAEYFHINPYQLIGSGSMLIAAKDGERLVEDLAKADIPATVIGRTTDTNDRILRNRDEIRYLTPPTADELYKVV